MRPLALLLLLAIGSPAIANRDGWANARQKAERLERRGEFADASVWWAAAAETLQVDSAPLSALGIAEATEDADPGALAWWKVCAEEDAKAAAEALDRAKTCAAKAGPIPEETRATVRQFLDGSIMQDAGQFWTAGHFEIRIASRKAAGDPVGALELEARARRRWAARFLKICIPYWKKRGDEKRLVDCTKQAIEQMDLAEKVMDRANDLARSDGWESMTLRAALRVQESPGKQREAVERLAVRGDMEGLRLALECSDSKARDFAARALVRVNDLLALAIPMDSAGGQSLATEIDAAAALPTPEFFVARLAGLSTTDSSVRNACARSLRVALPEASFDAGGPLAGNRTRFEDALDILCKPGVSVEFRASPENRDVVARETWEDFDHEWGREAPEKSLPADGWDLRASGFLVMKDDAVVELLVQCDDAVRVRVDNRTVIDEWAELPEPAYRRAPLRLSKGWHSIVLEYGDRSGVAVLRAWLALNRDEIEPLTGHLRRLAAK